MAMIIFNQRYKGRLAQAVPAVKAREIEAFLNNPPDNLTDDQSEFLLAIKKIYHGKPKRPSDKPYEAENTLTHEGIQQGMYSAIPNNDR